MLIIITINMNPSETVIISTCKHQKRTVPNYYNHYSIAAIHHNIAALQNSRLSKANTPSIGEFESFQWIGKCKHNKYHIAQEKKCMMLPNITIDVNINFPPVLMRNLVYNQEHFH